MRNAGNSQGKDLGDEDMEDLEDFIVFEEFIFDEEGEGIVGWGFVEREATEISESGFFLKGFS